MAKIRKIEPTIPQIKKRKKVAAYARVSRDTERLAHSLSAQVSYYSRLIQNNPEWEYAGVYADYALSGTSAEKRPDFQRLLADCEEKKIDIILTKSISRFARNTVDLLETVRHLKELGIEVRFEKEHINSLSEDGELMLSLLASFAQEESRSISENCKWGVRKRFASGEMGTANKHILGYRYDEEQRKYVIIPEEAEVVRWIFQLYLDGVSLQGICDKLTEKGYRSINGIQYMEGTMAGMVRNEVYAGDTLRQKTYVTDPISKRQVKNKGELPMYYIADTHEAIIDRETWGKIQEETARRESLWRPEYCFTGKIKCGTCGMPYSRSLYEIKSGKCAYWTCRANKEVGTSCTGIKFKESELMKICAKVLGIDSFSEEEFNRQVLDMTILKNGSIEFHMVGGETRLWKNLRINESRHIATLTECFKGRIFCGICGKEYHRVNSVTAGHVYWFCIGKKLKGMTCSNKNYADYQLRNISAWMLGLSEFDEAEFDKQVEKITVQPDGNLLYHFYDGRTSLWQR
ncbi:MAG: recombinase family protein [Lachnospiraceae bacterium]|nr:recombinase family protein [Lachnospiraceae bacterium]